MTAPKFKLVVSKFGGTSMGDAACMLRSAEVCIKRNSNVVVVSATSGTTNDLIQLGKLAEAQLWAESEALIQKIKNRHLQIAHDLDLVEATNSTDATPDKNKLLLLFDELESLARGIFLLRDCSAKALDALMSLGEKMSSLLFTKALEKRLNQSDKANVIDIRTVLITDDDFGKAKPNFSEIALRCQTTLLPKILTGKILVTQGFIGATPEGFTTTLGRGGSDYSAAILAEGLNAQALEIWTDVPGIASTDPRICPQAKPIDNLSFKEASELAVFGAKVLHPATIIPAMRKNIPTFVGSSFNSEEKGTWIYREATHYPLVRAIAIRTKQILVTLTTPEMLNAAGFLYQIFKVFHDYQVSIDAITTSEISIALTLDSTVLSNKSLFADLAKFADVQIEEDLNLVALIGNNINHTPGLANQIFESIVDINVRMICLGASRHNFCFLVKQDFGQDAVRRLHKTFIEANTI